MSLDHEINPGAPVKPVNVFGQPGTTGRAETGAPANSEVTEHIAVVDDRGVIGVPIQEALPTPAPGSVQEVKGRKWTKPTAIGAAAIAVLTAGIGIGKMASGESNDPNQARPVAASTPTPGTPTETASPASTPTEVSPTATPTESAVGYQHKTFPAVPEREVRKDEDVFDVISSGLPGTKPVTGTLETLQNGSTLPLEVKYSGILSPDDRKDAIRAGNGPVVMADFLSAVQLAINTADEQQALDVIKQYANGNADVEKAMQDLRTGVRAGVPAPQEGGNPVGFTIDTNTTELDPEYDGNQVIPNAGTFTLTDGSGKPGTAILTTRSYNVVNSDNGVILADKGKVVNTNWVEQLSVVTRGGEVVGFTAQVADAYYGSK